MIEGWESEPFKIIEGWESESLTFNHCLRRRKEVWTVLISYFRVGIVNNVYLLEYRLL